MYEVLTEDPLICKCANVRKRQIKLTIRQFNCKTTHDVFKNCGACCCCCTCKKDIEEIIEVENKPKSVLEKIVDFIKG